MEIRGKVLGAGYEAYIMAFFIGLYANKRLQLSDETKVLGQPIQYWGNLDSKRARKAYPQLRSYIFIALVARTEIDWIALDKGDIKVPTVISKLLETMEEYADTVCICFLMSCLYDEISLYNERRCNPFGTAPLNVKTECQFFMPESWGLALRY